MKNERKVTIIAERKAEQQVRQLQQSWVSVNLNLIFVFFELGVK